MDHKGIPGKGPIQRFKGWSRTNSGPKLGLHYAFKSPWYEPNNTKPLASTLMTTKLNEFFFYIIQLAISDLQYAFNDTTTPFCGIDLVTLGF